jgi:hypothetical protein
MSRRITGVLSASWWVGLAGIAAILALVPIAVASWGGSDPQQTSPSPGSNVIAGDCNAQGTNNTVACNILPTPPSMAAVKYGLSGDNFHMFFAGQPGELPTPPDFELATGHCKDWGDWLQATPGMYMVGPSVDVQLQAGEPDLVTVTNVEVEIFKRTPIASNAGTVIQCSYGGGSNSYYLVNVDTVARSTTLVEDALSGAEPIPMPPASITLAEKGFETVRIGLSSMEGQLYEGRIVVTVIVNGAEKKLGVGSPQAPLKWIQSDSRFAIGSPGYTYHDWSMVERRWVKDLSPFE